MVGKTISHYTIVEELGEGGMGVVYRAHDTKLDRDVAIKFLPTSLLSDDESRARLELEARAASALEHPNICTVHDFGDADGQPFLVFALIEGETLEARLAQGPLSIEQTVETARQIARGLCAAHERGIIHRDLKPSNIMIDRHGVVKIMDFGLARREGKTHLTRTGTTLGTLPYMSPEQIQGNTVDQRTDLWSLGVILDEMLTGKRPFPADYDAALMYQILNEQPHGADTIQEISPPLAALIGSLLEKDPELRTRSASEVLDQLKKIHAGEVSLQVREAATHQIREKSESITQRAVREFRRRRMVPIVGVYILVALGLLQGGSYVINQTGLDGRWHQILLIWLLCGLPLAALGAYYHGMRGPLRIRRSEVGIVSAIVVIATGVSIWSWRTSPTVALKPKPPFPEPVSSIAVMYFEDNTGGDETKWLSKGLPHMLITSLEQIPELQVVGYQRLHDILKELAREGTETIDRSTATEVARVAGVKTMLLGSIFKWGDRFRVDYQLQNVKEGNLISAEKVDGDDPFKLADAITLSVLKHLSIFSSVPAKGIADVTTTSIEAYRLYIKAQEFMDGGMWKEAGDSFSACITQDSTFAMAYYGMWTLAHYSGIGREALEQTKRKALKYSSRVSDRERLKIESGIALYSGNLSAFRYANGELITRYPDEVEAYKLFGEYYYGRREIEKGLAYYKKAAELSYYTGLNMEMVFFGFFYLDQLDSVESYLKMVKNDFNFVLLTELRLLLEHGKLEEALEKARQEVGLVPQQPWAHRLLGNSYFLLGKYDSAETEYKKVSSLGWNASGMMLCAMTYLAQGKYGEAERHLLGPTTRKQKDEKSRLLWLLRYYDLTGREKEAQQTWSACRSYRLNDVSGKGGFDTYRADSLLRLSIPDLYYANQLTQALQLCDSVEQEIASKDLGGGYKLDVVEYRARILFKNGDHQEASSEYEYLVREAPTVFSRYRLGECCYHTARYREAKEVLSTIEISGESVIGWLLLDCGYAYPRKFYLLGKISEALGEKEEAIKAFRQFLDIWKNADKDLPELIEARERLATLTRR